MRVPRFSVLLLVVATLVVPATAQAAKTVASATGKQVGVSCTADRTSFDAAATYDRNSGVTCVATGAPVKITSVTLTQSGSQFDVYGDGCTGHTLRPATKTSAATTCFVFFSYTAPTATDVARGVVHIGGDGVSADIPLSGRGHPVGSLNCVTPTTDVPDPPSDSADLSDHVYEFGRIRVGVTRRVTITCKSTGPAGSVAAIRSISRINTGSAAGSFDLDASGGTCGHFPGLVSGQSCTLIVSLSIPAPTAVDAVSAIVFLGYDGMVGIPPDVRVLLQATGVA